MNDLPLGIDLGTTNSAVAVVRDGAARILGRRDTGQLLLPSMVGFTPSGERVVGERARFLAETFPESVAVATKRFIGRRWSPELAAEARRHLPFQLVAGPQEDIRVRLSGRTLPVSQVAAMILSELRLDAEAETGKEAWRAVVTVPANFNEAQRVATREAARLAGLDVLRLLNEPTAAALAYGLGSGFRGRALVFDLGGGTFDVSILEIEDGKFTVVATGGDPFLGGEDFDATIVQWLLALLDPAVKERVLHDPVSFQRIKVVAEAAKRAVSTATETPIATELLADLHGHGVRLETLLTRAFFEQIARRPIQRCLEVVDATLADSGLAAEQIDAVLLVGGMTRAPIIREQVAARFGRDPVEGIDPDGVVALGAALHAHTLVGAGVGTELFDVNSATLGIAVAGGSTQVLIRKNQPLPAASREIFHPARDGQTTVRLGIVQGESHKAAENFRLGELVLEAIDPAPRSEVAIEVTFDMRADGLLAVSARNLRTGETQTARIVARPQLGDSERKQMREAEDRYRDGVVAARSPD